MINIQCPYQPLNFVMINKDLIQDRKFLGFVCNHKLSRTSKLKLGSNYIRSSEGIQTKFEFKFQDYITFTTVEGLNYLENLRRI